ncbi:MAG: hypothetical protein Q9166_003356 [cf. Caloplaca sp. 2 TL-2023]
MGHFVRIMKEPQGQPLRRWTNEIPNDGMIRYLDFFNRERIAVFGSRALAEVLVQKPYDFIKPPQFAGGIGNVLGIGLFLAEGDEHKRQRKNLLPAFSYRYIKDLHPIFWSKSQELVHFLSRHIETTKDGHIDIDDWASRATLDVIGLAAFGHNFQTIQVPSNVIGQTYRTILSPNRWSRILGFLSFFVPTILHTSEITQASNFIRILCRHMVQAKKNPVGLRLLQEPPDRDILSIAVASGAFSTEDLVNQLMTFLVAGHETTTAAMGWSIYELCRNPNIQKRIRQEVRTHIPPQHFGYVTNKGFKGGEEGEEGKFEAKLIDRCTYLHAFCSEILRLYPPIPLTMRVAARHTSIAGTAIPKGTTIILAPWAINTSISMWGEDAHLFKPERWLNMITSAKTAIDPGESPLDTTQRPLFERQKLGNSESTYSFMTFLHGPRSCIGQSFARAELACLVAAWVDQFDTSFAETSAGDTGRLQSDGERYVNGVEVVTGISARPGNLRVKIRQAERDA